MTETEWLACEDNDALIWWTLQAVTRRKACLFAVACCRRCWDLLGIRECRDAVEILEQYADRGVDHYRFIEAETRARKAIQVVANRVARGKLTPAHQDACNAVLAAMNPWNPFSTQNMSHHVAQALGEPTADAHHAQLLRDTNNPFFTGSVSPACLTWQDGVVTGLAQSAYRSRHLPSGHLDTARLAVLSDALEDAGCNETLILEHLRSPGPHVRGCWALDLILGKS